MKVNKAIELLTDWFKPDDEIMIDWLEQDDIILRDDKSFPYILINKEQEIKMYT